MMNITNFLSRWNNASIEDNGSYISDDFKEFAGDVKSFLKNSGNFELISFNVGHYDIFAFVKQGDKYIYISFSAPRGEIPLDLNREDPMQGWLYRLADGPKDYTGRTNHFSNFHDLIYKVDELFERGI